MSAEENRSALLDAVRDWNAGRYQEYLDFYAPDVVLHGYAPGLPPGSEGAEAFYRTVWAAYPDSQLAVHAVIVEDDLLACRYTLQGAQQGVFMGAPPQGQSMQVEGQTIMRMKDGKCVERWNQADMLSWMQQLGIIPQFP